LKRRSKAKQSWHPPVKSGTGDAAARSLTQGKDPVVRKDFQIHDQIVGGKRIRVIVAAVSEPSFDLVKSRDNCTVSAVDADVAVNIGLRQIARSRTRYARISRVEITACSLMGT